MRADSISTREPCALAAAVAVAASGAEVTGAAAVVAVDPADELPTASAGRPWSKLAASAAVVATANGLHALATPRRREGAELIRLPDRRREGTTRMDKLRNCEDQGAEVKIGIFPRS